MRRVAAGVVAAVFCTPAGSSAATGATPAPLFRDGTGAAGLVVSHDNGNRGRLELLAIMGPGAALFDYDLDGDLDLYMPRGGTLPSDRVAAGAAPGVSHQGGGVLLRNDLHLDGQGAPAPRFVDVTVRAGLGGASGYGMAAATGDADGDGAPELLVAKLGPNELWHNRGDGSFVAATPAALLRPGWSTGGTFFDAEGDGDLDLYVIDYVDPVPGVLCYAESSRPDYCGPASYRAIVDRLVRNDGRGAWTEVTGSAGIAGEARPGLGVLTIDADADGRLDLWVANDGQPNLLWRNRGDGTFVDTGLVSGTALSRDGLARSGMGVAAGDLDGDGDEELYVTNLTGEPNTLYVNGGDGFFEDRTAEWGLAAPSLPWTGFGTAFVDADLDGWLDVVVVNGAVRLADASASTGAPADGGGAAAAGLAQPAQLYRNLGGGRFESLSAATAGEALVAPVVGRGLAPGDVEGDGDTDLVVAVNDGATKLLLSTPPAARWQGVAPCPGVADAAWLARRAVVTAAGGGSSLPPLVRRPHRDGSYASARDPRVLFGLGAVSAGSAPRATALELVGTGARLRWREPPLDRYLLWCPGE